MAVDRAVKAKNQPKGRNILNYPEREPSRARKIRERERERGRARKLGCPGEK